MKKARRPDPVALRHGHIYPKKECRLREDSQKKEKSFSKIGSPSFGYHRIQKILNPQNFQIFFVLKTVLYSSSLNPTCLLYTHGRNERELGVLRNEVLGDMDYFEALQTATSIPPYRKKKEKEKNSTYLRVWIYDVSRSLGHRSSSRFHVTHQSWR